MKFIIILIGIFTLFHAVLTLKCYHCNFPDPDRNDPNCTNYEVVECVKDHYCAENGLNIVSKLCEPDYICDRSENCCKDALCNTQHLQIKQKNIKNGSENMRPSFLIFLSAVLLVAV